MSNEHKTRAERIEDAARAVTESLYPSDEQAIHVGSLAAALALPPDPPRGDGWEALRAVRELTDPANEDPALGEWVDGHNAAMSHIRSKIDRLLAAAPKEPEPAESSAEPAQYDEAVIGAWLQRIGGVSADCHRMPAHIDSGVYGAMQSGYAIMCRLAHEKADLRAKLAASDEILAEVRVEADGLMRALRRIAKLGKGGA